MTWQVWQAQPSAWGGPSRLAKVYEVDLGLAGGIALSVAAAGLGAVAEGSLSGGHIGLLDLLGRVSGNHSILHVNCI